MQTEPVHRRLSLGADPSNRDDGVAEGYQVAQQPLAKTMTPRKKQLASKVKKTSKKK
jgi:hypothetical protein